MRDRALLKNDQIARSRAEIGQADAEFAFIGPQHGVRASQRLKDGVVHMDASPVHRRHQILRRARRGGHNVHAHFKPRGHHAHRILHARLIVENEFLRQQMQNFAIGGQRHGAGLVHRLADFVAADFPRRARRS